MQTPEHQRHIASRIAHNDCQECRADCERQFLRPQWQSYQHVSEYLAWCRPRFAAIRAGGLSDREATAAAQWIRKFREALHRRITLKVGSEQGRKRCDSYLERMGQFPRNTDNAYLRRFARRGASTLY